MGGGGGNQRLPPAPPPGGRREPESSSCVPQPGGNQRLPPASPPWMHRPSFVFPVCCTGLPQGHEQSLLCVLFFFFFLCVLVNAFPDEGLALLSLASCPIPTLSHPATLLYHWWIWGLPVCVWPSFMFPLSSLLTSPLDFGNDCSFRVNTIAGRVCSPLSSSKLSSELLPEFTENPVGIFCLLELH